MKECTSCEYRVEEHPEYREMKWEDLPCATCDGTMKQATHIPFDDRLLYEQCSTLSDVPQDTLMNLMGYAFRCWLCLDPTDRSILSERCLRPELSLTDVANMHGLSRATLYKAYRRILSKYPVLAALTPYRSK